MSETVKIIPLWVLFPELKMFRSNSTNPKNPKGFWQKLKDSFKTFWKWLRGSETSRG